MQEYNIIYLAPTIKGGDVQTDDLATKEERVVGEENRNKRLQELIDEGYSPVYREVN